VCFWGVFLGCFLKKVGLGGGGVVGGLGGGGGVNQNQG